MLPQTFFEPRTVAVIGVSRHRGGIGAEVFHNLVAGGFRGDVVPVNPRAQVVEGITAYARVADIPRPVDLAVVAVPAACVDASIDDCLAAGVGAIVVISAGFGETGEAGRAQQARLAAQVRTAGARMIGPNCMGVLNMNPAIRMNASFSPVFPPGGRTAFSSQSGALGLAILAAAESLRLGISTFASIGNQADVSTSDLVEYWGDDPQTGLILLYIESFADAPRFRRIAREVARHKPIVAIKAGRSPAGARAAASHTGALAAPDRLVDALFRDCGVVRADTLEELFDVAQLLGTQPVPQGPRVAILTNAGGPGILAGDACVRHGLTVPALAPDTIDALRSFLPAAASVGNPVDMLATASAEDFRRALPLLLRDPNVDSVVVIFIPPLVTRAGDAALAIADGARETSKPVLATFFGAAGAAEALAAIPCYAFPEAAVEALAHAVAYGAWRAMPPASRRVFAGVDAGGARAIVERVRAAGDGWLAPLDAMALLDAYGIARAATLPVADESQAVSLAHEVGYPVALKGLGPGILHKTEAHAVHLGLAGERQVRDAFGALAARVGDGVDHILLQPMLDGVEFIVGASHDPTFGHVIVCGAGGTMVELLGDSTCALHPLTEATARDMLNRLRGVVLLRGFRGAPVRNEAALVEMLLRVSALLDDCPEVVELDLNPVMVNGSGATAVDVRIRIAPCVST